MKRLVFSLMIAAAVTACFAPAVQHKRLGADPLTARSGETRRVDNVLVVTDASNTQVRYGTYGQAKSLAEDFVRGMPNADVRAIHPNVYNAGVIGFGGGDRVGAPLAPFDREVLERVTCNLHPLPPPNGGTTPLTDVLNEAAAELAGKSGPAAIVLFSDGSPDSQEAALAAAQRLVSGYSDGVCIHTVQTGDSADGRAFLERLSNVSNCGSSRNGNSIGSASDLSAFVRAALMGAGRGSTPAPQPRATSSTCDGRIVLRGVRFQLDRAVLLDRSKAVLDAAVQQLQQCPDLRISIDGHTCSLGSNAYNDQLSQRRATAVRTYLISTGIPASRLTTRAYGESTPVATNENEEGREQNRRVELTPAR